MWWYDEYPHVGYDLDGRRIIKPPQRDQIDEFLKYVSLTKLYSAYFDFCLTY